MKILIQSDLHLDYNKRQVDDIEERYIQKMKEKEADIIIVAGDMSSNLGMTKRIIRRLKEEAGKKVYYVIGNHDLYAKERTRHVLKRLKEMEEVLVNESVSLNDEWVLIGGFSWYDYTFKPSYVDEDTVREHKKRKWNDAAYVYLEEEDEIFSKRMQKEIKEEFEKHKGKKIIFANHFVSYEDFLMFTNEYDWNVNNAFMGTAKLGKEIDKAEEIAYSIFGHTHKRYGMVEYNGKKNICNPLGYYFEWKTKKPNEEFELELEKATIEIDI